MHPDGHVPERRLRRLEPGDVRRVGSMPRCGGVRPVDGNVLEPEQGRRDGVLGRKCVYADGHVPVRHVYGLESGDVHGQRPVPCSRYVRSKQWSVFEPSNGRWDRVL